MNANVAQLLRTWCCPRPADRGLLGTDAAFGCPSSPGVRCSRFGSLRRVTGPYSYGKRAVDEPAAEPAAATSVRLRRTGVYCGGVSTGRPLTMPSCGAAAMRFFGCCGVNASSRGTGEVWREVSNRTDESERVMPGTSVRSLFVREPALLREVSDRAD